MRKLFLTILLLSFFATSFAQKMTLRTCVSQYGKVINHNLNDIVMEGDFIPYVCKFQLTNNNFIEIFMGERYKYEYVSTNGGFKANEDFNIIIKDKLLNEYDVTYSYKKQTLTFIYLDGDDNLKVNRFTIDHVKVK